MRRDVANRGCGDVYYHFPFGRSLPPFFLLSLRSPVVGASATVGLCVGNGGAGVRGTTLNRLLSRPTRDDEVATFELVIA